MNYNKYLYFVVGGQGNAPKVAKVAKKNPR